MIAAALTDLRCRCATCRSPRAAVLADLALACDCTALTTTCDACRYAADLAAKWRMDAVLSD